MNPTFNNPFEKFVRERNETAEPVVRQPMDARNIDDMLAALDRVLNDDVTIQNVEAEQPAPILETVEAILLELTDACARLELAATADGAEEIVNFVANTRPQLQKLLRRFGKFCDPVTGHVEFELDFEALHAFMLYPDVSNLAS